MKGTQVLVTGASGFIASHLVEQLLLAGARVRGTVRSLAKTEGHAHLRAMAGAGDRLELVEASLEDDGAFDAHVRGCSVVFHTASPYFLDPKDAARDLVEPAVRGTRNVLEACAKTTGIQRVVLTSSMAAITDEPDPTKVLTEADWNERSSLTRNPYYFSKAEAERAAWRFMEATTTEFDLVAINPFVVLGPSHTKTVNPSNAVVVDLFTGRFPGIIALTWGIVDVRDVARAHVLAAERRPASGRYLCAAGTISMRDLVTRVRATRFGSRKLPSLPLDSPAATSIVKLYAYTQPAGTRSYLLTHLGREPRVDNAKIQRDLGLVFRPLDDTLRDTLEDLEQWGHLPGAP